MSEEKIASKMNQSSKEILTTNEITELTETKTSPVQENAFPTDAEKTGNTNGEKLEKVLAVDESLTRSSKKSAISFEASSSNLLRRPSRSVGDFEQLPEESFTEQSDFYRSSEINYNSELEEYEFSTQKDYVKSQGIVDPNDPNAIRLQTDTHVLHLSRLPVVPPDVPESSYDRLFDAASLLSSLKGSSLYRKSTSTLMHVEHEPSDFFEKLGDVPSLSDISADISDETRKSDRKSDKLRRGSGRFVDPLTGDHLPFEIEQKLEVHVKIESESSVFEEEAAEEAEPDQFSFEDFDAMHLANEMELAPRKQKQEEDMLDILIAKNQLEGRMLFGDGAEVMEDESLNLENILAEQIDKFLSDLIRQVVRFVEDEENAIKLRQNLDKKKLLKQIETVVDDLYTELSMRKFLDRKATEYFRRRQLLRYIIPEKSEQRVVEFEKNRDVEERLDNLLGEESLMLKKTASKIEELQMERAELEENDKMLIAKFHQLVRNTLKREDMPHLEELIEKDLRRMKELSKEISEVRSTVISHQHVLGTLKAQIEELGNIGNGLHVADYEAIQRETVTISKKIEDRANELNKLHDRFRTNLHVIAHSKLRNEVYSKRIAMQTKTLTILEHEETLCRQSIFEQKKDRNKLKRQIKELSFQSGLLDKPVLLQDYDKTMERLEKQRKMVENLRLTHKKLEKKWKHLEKLCTNK